MAINNKFELYQVQSYDVVFADKSKLSTSKIIAIVAPISASVVLFIVGCCFLIWRGKKYNAVDGENGNE